MLFNYTNNQNRLFAKISGFLIFIFAGTKLQGILNIDLVIDLISNYTN